VAVAVEVVDGKLRCIDCKRVLPVEQFHVNRARKCGYTSYCKICSKVRTDGWRAANPDRNRAVMNEWRRKNAARVAEYDRRHHLMHEYGLTPEEYDAMVARQDGKCAACGSDDPRNNQYGRWPIDHDHATRTVRELLCNPCNVAIGQVNDDVDRLMALATYLLKHRNVLTLGGLEGF
jgi:hypothetical protein